MEASVQEWLNRTLCRNGLIESYKDNYEGKIRIAEVNWEPEYSYLKIQLQKPGLRVEKNSNIQEQMFGCMAV